MDHVVRIDGRSDTTTPIVLHLLPGEETIFNLVVINDGEPSDVSLSASDPVFKAVRFRRSDDHVDGKQVIPIFARMPDETDRLEGEIILKSRSGEIHVPITILRDSTPFERPGRRDCSSRSASPGQLSRPNSRAWIRDIAPAEDGQEDYLKDKEDPDASGSGMDILDDDEVDDGGEDVDRDPYDPSGDLDTEFNPANDDQDAENEKESGHLSFSKDTDLEMYRSARRFRQVEDLSLTESDQGEENMDQAWESDSLPRADGNYNHPDRDRPGGDRTHRSLSGFMQGPGGGSNPYVPIDPHDPPRDEQGFQSNEVFGEHSKSDTFRSAEVAGEEVEEDDYRAIGATQIIPAVIFLGLVSALVLTFITESIPEFPGALVSSILIVTLIIYGAATLLKA